MQSDLRFQKPSNSKECPNYFSFFWEMIELAAPPLSNVLMVSERCGNTIKARSRTLPKHNVFVFDYLPDSSLDLPCCNGEIHNI